MQNRLEVTDSSIAGRKVKVCDLVLEVTGKTAAEARDKWIHEAAECLKRPGAMVGCVDGTILLIEGGARAGTYRIVRDGRECGSVGSTRDHAPVSAVSHAITQCGGVAWTINVSASDVATGTNWGNNPDLFG